MTALIDARTLTDKTELACDIAIIGAGPAGISLALALADSKLKVLLLEAGGMSFDDDTQKLYEGHESGVRYPALDQGRLRFLGGSSNHWGGWCRPLDAIDFEKRDWVAHSGWPFARSTIEPYFARAQALCEAGAWTYDRVVDPQQGPLLPLGAGGLYTSWFQFSKTRGGILPTYFGTRYAQTLKSSPNITTYTNINVTGIRLSANGQSVARLDTATLTGKHFTIKPKLVVMAAGAIETARLMLASRDVVKPGVGNQNDLVGRFFADHPVPRRVAKLVSFAGSLAPCYGSNVTLGNGAVMRVALSPTASFCRSHSVVGSLTTIEEPADLDETGKAAVITTAISLGVNAANAKTYWLGCGMELEPDPDRRLTLTGDTDALGLPRLKLDMRISDQDFARYRQTLEELGRQLLASKAGMLRISYDQRDEWLGAMDWGNHHLGTARMSDDPKTGVVNADSQVHGVANLFVAGSAVFPTYGSSNPTLNLIALTLRLADHLKKVAA